MKSDVEAQAIIQYLARLGKNISELRNAIDDLVERISPILIPTYPEANVTTNPTQDSASVSEVRLELESFISRVDGLRRLVSETIVRVDL